MSDAIRDSPLGQLIRYTTRNKFLRYLEEKDDFQCPPQYTKGSLPSPSEPSSRTAPVAKNGFILVDWYSHNDPDNPQNWAFGRKAFASFIIYFYTLAIYMGSAIYAPSATGVMEYFGVSAEVATLGLSLYVLAYGIGPLIFSPLSEIPSVGRSWPYITTMVIFVILCVPTALVDNIAGLLVLRFLQGFFGSPALATGAASLADMYSLSKLPYAIGLWALSCTSGPSLGPVISGFSVPVMGWRWSLWEILWLSAPGLLLMMCLPETSADNILLRRAQRLRSITGNMQLRSQSELDQANLHAKDVVFEALVRPMLLIVLDPAIAYTAAYTSLCYGIYYSFFEVFPMVYIERYGFSVGEMGLTFLSINVGSVTAIAMYYSLIYWIVEPTMRTQGPGAPEQCLKPALFSSFLLPAGLFIFAWTANGHTHWMASVFGIFLFSLGMFIVMQCIFAYLPWVYPKYAASVFAGNDFARSSLAFAAVMFSRPMYEGLGIGPGTSLLAALTAACIGGIFVLFFYGHVLRAKSRFAAREE